ncbi:uncharacterized protein GIQ15_05162 [Arthroderma uncinatum]|uniref:uncharacterized protein n=1 Tax=Arthroderma uncinatum TaxID=74035 RepID=UPI00144AA0D7|nr:uncharacterized protein GIQ15_05162 [Arthroderma uncinatum]KAF3482403.1 hypothetical protein GIQ15_05162 [Arthroderma uncinatum]
MAEIKMEDAGVPLILPSAQHECSRKWPPAEAIDIYTKTDALNPDDGIPDMLHTCYHPYHSAYSPAHLPPLLFRLDAPTEPPMPRIIRYLTKDGAISYVKESNAIKDFQFLLRYISVRVSGWLLEYWMRTDPRLTYRDIKARMTASPSDIPSDNALNMRREREARLPLGLSCWTTRRGEITRTEVERVERWSQPQISLNTTMEVEHATSARTNEMTPVCLLMRRLDGGKPQRYVLDTFMDGREGPHVPGLRITAAIQLLYQLQDFANVLDTKDWRYLPGEYLPESWIRRTGPRTKSQAGSSTDSDMKFDLIAPSESGKKKMNVGKRVGYQAAYSEGGSEKENMNEGGCHCGAVNRLKEDDEDAPSDMPGDQPALGNMSSPIHSKQNTVWKFAGSASPSQQVSYSSSQPEQSDYYGEQPHTNTLSDPSCIDQPVIQYNPQLTVNIYGAPYNESSLQQQSQKVLSIPSSAQHTSQETLNQPPPYFSQSYDGGNEFMSNQHQTPKDQGSDFLSMSPPSQQYEVPEPFRFNGAGLFSIRNNPAHRLNTNTSEVMERNNPFLDLDSPSIANQRSFDDFFTADLE